MFKTSQSLVLPVRQPAPPPLPRPLHCRSLQRGFHERLSQSAQRYHRHHFVSHFSSRMFLLLSCAAAVVLQAAVLVSGGRRAAGGEVTKRSDLQSSLFYKNKKRKKWQADGSQIHEALFLTENGSKKVDWNWESEVLRAANAAFKRHARLKSNARISSHRFGS